jgi:uncharacterized membrane protein YkoI
MTNDPALLVHRYLEGSLEEAESAEFNVRVRNDPDFRALLARMSFDEVVLRELIGPAESQPAAAPRPAPAGRWHWMATRGSVAAAAALLVAIAALLVFSGRGAGLATVVSGRLAVDGIEATRASEGSRVTVIGDKPAVVRFRDGVTAEFSPATEAVLNDGSVEVVRGIAGFTGTLRVVTPLGRVDVRGGALRTECEPDFVKLTLTGGAADFDRTGLVTSLADGASRDFRRERVGKGNKAWVEYSRRLAEARLTLLQAAAKAGGPAFSVEFDVEEKRLTWEVKFAKGTQEGELKVDAADGSIVEDDLSPEDCSALVKGIPLADAVATALREAPGSRAVSAEFKIRQNRLIARTVVVAGERLLRITVDGLTGDVIDRCVEDDDD